MIVKLGACILDFVHRPSLTVDLQPSPGIDVFGAVTSWAEETPAFAAATARAMATNTKPAQNAVAKGSFVVVVRLGM